MVSTGGPINRDIIAFFRTPDRRAMNHNGTRHCDHRTIGAIPGAWVIPMAQLPPRRPLYDVDPPTFAALRSLDHVEWTRYRALRHAGIPPQEALPLAREVEDPLPEIQR